MVKREGGPRRGKGRKKKQKGNSRPTKLSRQNRRLRVVEGEGRNEREAS